MFRRSPTNQYRMHLGEMLIDYKIQSRDLRKSALVEGALVDPTRRFCTAPMHWLEALRSPSNRLPSGYYRERPVYVAPPGATAAGASAGATTTTTNQQPNAIRAGPLIMNISGEASPVVVHIDFVDPVEWGMKGNEDSDLRVGLEAIEQCTLFHELRPGGLLSKQPVDVLKMNKHLGIQTKLAESPLTSRPWTRMKTYFIDELQRGPAMKEYVGYNHRVGHEWRFSQHCKHFRLGIWKETTRRNELIEGLQSYSSYQRSHQQAVPEIRFMAPGP